MRYIKLENNVPSFYSIEQLLIDYHGAIIYKKSMMPNEELLKNYNVYPLVTTSEPSVKEDETVYEGTPEFKDREWYQTWVIRKLTDEEIKDIIDTNTSLITEDASNSSLGFFSSKELQEQRYEVCKSCNSFTTLKTCQECGCIIPLKIKLKNSVCPVNKW
jgi:hypothetical protein